MTEMGRGLKPAEAPHSRAVPDGMDRFRTVAEIARSLAERGERPAITTLAGEAATSTSYPTLGEDALRIARGLVAAGLRPGEFVLIGGPSGPAWVAARLGISLAGGVAAAIDEAATPPELATIASDSGARFGFLGAAHLGHLPDLPHRIGLEGPGEGVADWRGFGADAEGAPLPEIAEDAADTLVYTSGTTGKPKSFLLSHGNILHNVRELGRQGIATHDSRILMPLPLHHIYPVTVGLLSPLALGAEVVIPETVTGPAIVTALKARRCTLMIAVPRLYVAIADGLQARARAKGPLAFSAFRTLLALSRFVRQRTGVRIGRRLFGQVHAALGGELRTLASGGARFEADPIWTLEALGFEVLSGWGLAETASILTNNRRGQVLIGAEGFALPGVELRTLPAEGAEPGSGELQARGASVFQGYRDNPDANAVAFTEDGWFRTGDIGRIDPSGHVHILGRIKEMIVLGGGKNVYPEETEKALAAGSPLIREIAVMERNGALVALVVPDEAKLAEGGLVRPDDAVRVALATASQGLPPWQRPAGFSVTREPLPRTRLGKVQRFLLPRLYAEAEAGRGAAAERPWTDADRESVAEPTAARLWSLLEERFAPRKLHPDLSPVLDLGLDSLGWITLAVEIEARTGIRFTEEDTGSAATLRDLLVRAPERLGSTRVEAPLDLAWLDERSSLEAASGAALHGLNAALTRLLFGLRVEGREHLPADGPLIVAANHVSDLDPSVLAAALDATTRARMRWSGDRERLFGTGLGRWFARAVRLFPVAEREPRTALAYAEAVLGRGEALAWFPESWRSPDGALQRFQPGVGELVRRTGASVVPARIAGSFEVWPRSRRLPRPGPVTVRFGPALSAQVLGGPDADPATIAARIREAVAALPTANR